MHTAPRTALRNSTLSLVGLGKLGCFLAACFADKGIDVLGVDIEERVVNALNESKTLSAEPDLLDGRQTLQSV